MRSVHPHRRGFTIIELVVVIGVVMVLIGIFLPVLGGARNSAQRTILASQVRQMAIMVSAYCDEYDGVYPIADERFWFLPYYRTPNDQPYPMGRYWAQALVDSGFMTIEEARDPSYIDASNQNLSVAMCYDPLKMKPTSIEAYKDRYTHPIRQYSARYPSGKGMLWVSVVTQTPNPVYWCCTAIDPPGPVAFADTSVDTIAWHKLTTPTPSPILGIGTPVSSTWSGIYGKDR